LYIGKFIKEVASTRETVRYYIEEQLLTPQKREGKYYFTSEDLADFMAVRELRSLGLPIRLIKEINQNRKACGTKTQWQANLQIIEQELNRVQTEINTLTQRQNQLLDLQNQLRKKLS